MSKEVAGLVRIALLTICIMLLIGVLNVVFDDTPRQPRPYEASLQACLNKGGVPIMHDGSDSYIMKECQQ